MSVFEFRQWVEEMVPWWVPFAVAAAGGAILVAQHIIQRRK